MTRQSLLLLPVALLLFAGCPDEKPQTTQPSATTASTTPAPSASTASAAPSGSASAGGKMAHCPNAVTGATVDFKDIEGGVEMTITSKDAKATADIRDRSKHLGDVAKEMAKERAADPSAHNGSGKGGSVHGRCPALIRDATLDVAEVEGGSKMTIKAINAAETDWVRRETRERQAEIADPSAKGAGEHKMAHCPSAVTGVTTTLKDAKDAVVVTVVAKDEAGGKEVRERAKHLVEAAKKDPTTVKHDGEGDGGGGIGRCPVVLKDTTLEAKDVPNGSEITIKPTKPTDLAALKKDVKDRVQNFNPATAGSATAGPAASAAPSAGKPPAK